MIKARIFIGLFALPFLCTGLWMLWSITHSLIEWGNMKGWEPVTAELVRGGYNSHSDGDGGTTYSVFAEYTYRFNGQHYTGNRAAISEGADNVGSFQEDLGNRLAGLQGQSIEAFANPDAPEEAVIDRSMRWAMVGFKSIFLVTFGGFGALMFFGALRTPPPEKDLTQGVYRDSPWLADDDWQTAAIGSSSKAAMYFAWFFTVMWNAVSAPIPFLLHDEITKKENYPALIGLLFPLVGMGLLVWAVRRTLEWKRFGAAPVTLDPFPGAIGGHVGGTIELPQPFDSKSEFHVTLASIHNYESGSGKNRSTEERVLWQDDALAYAESGFYGTRIIFRFNVPEGLNPSDAVRTGNSRHLWRLTLRAALEGVDIDRDYEIPVYATRQKSLRIADRAIAEQEKSTQAMETREARARLATRPGPQGEEIFFPMGRNIGPAVTGIIVGACFLAPGLFLILHEHMHVFGGIFAFIGGLIFLSCLYMPINSLSVSRDAGGNIVAVRCILGLPVKRSVVAAHDIQSLSSDSNFATNSGSRQIKHYTIYANLAGRKKIVIGEGFHGAGEADAAIIAIREKLGLTVKKED